MSAPVLWILAPGILAAPLYFIRHRSRITLVAGTLAALLLAFLAWKLPIGSITNIGPWSFKLADTLWVLGRRLVLTDSDRPILALIYALAAFWFAGALLARVGSLFIPLGMGVVACMVASLAVEPFLYAALLIELAALLCVPILSAPGKPAPPGVLRFVTFQTLGMLFILFTGWILTGVEASPSDMTLVVRGAVTMGLGFSFLLAVFPFHTWIPMLAEKTHPYAAAFVLFVLPGIVSLLGINFIQQYAWLRDSQIVFLLLRGAGVLMVVTGGLWAAFQRHLGRLMGYAVLIDIGMSFLVISTRPGFTPSGIQPVDMLTLFYALLVTRALALGVWALALSQIHSISPDLNFRAVQGLGRRLPLAAGALSLALFSLGGFPLLASFPVRLSLWETLSLQAPGVTLWSLIGSVGLLVGGIRSIAVLVMGPEETAWSMSEKRSLRVFLAVGVLVLVAAGLFPRY